MRYPLRPLLDAAGLSLSALRDRFPMSGATYRNARELGLTEAQADRYACGLGLVPWLVWSDWLEDAFVECAADGCTERFVPGPRGPHQRFCSSSCRRRHGERLARLEGRESAARKAELRRRYYEQHGDYERRRQREYDRRKRESAA